MARQDDLLNLDNKYAPLIQQLTDTLTSAQSTLNNAQGQYTELQRQINEYYDAIEVKATAETTIAKGIPSAKTIDDSVAALAIEVI